MSPANQAGPITETNFALGSHEKFQPCFRNEKRPRKKANMAKHKNHNFRDHHSFGNSFGCITAILSIPFKNGMLMMWKIQQEMQDDEVRSRPLNSREKRPLLAGKASPPSHMNTEYFTKDVEVKARSGKPGWCEDDLRRFTMSPGGWGGGGGRRGSELTQINTDRSNFFQTDRRAPNRRLVKEELLEKSFLVHTYTTTSFPRGKNWKKSWEK